MTGWPRPAEPINADGRAKAWRDAVPDITDEELAVVDGLLRSEPHHLRRLVATYRAGMRRGADRVITVLSADGDGRYKRLPLEQDLLAGTWPSDPLSEAELEAAVALGWDVDLLTTARAAPGARASLRQQLARKATRGDGDA